MALCDARARRLGVSRTDYVRHQLFDAPAGESAGPEFKSRDLVGSFAIGTGSTNERVREAMAKRAR